MLACARYLWDWDGRIGSTAEARLTAEARSLVPNDNIRVIRACQLWSSPVSKFKKRQAIPRQPSAGRKSGRVRRIASGSHCRSGAHGSAWRRYRRRLGAPWSGASKILQRLALRSVRERIGLSSELQIL
jgi:hypothetical protein